MSLLFHHLLEATAAETDMEVSPRTMQTGKAD
jgi:hypothetical protein